MKIQDNQKKPLTKVQIRKIKDSLKSSNNLRDMALFSLSIDSMLRSCDILKLTVKDILRVDGCILKEVGIKMGKGTQSVWVHFQEDTVQMLVDYINSTDKNLNDYIFTGRKNTGKPISYIQHTRLIKKWVSQIGLKPDQFSTHSIRRSKVSLVYKKTQDPEICRQLLGQDSITNTARYLGIKKRDPLKEAQKIVL